VKLLRRRQPEPEPVDTTAEWEELLHQYRTWAPRSVVRDRYHREARQRQRAKRAGANPHPPTGSKESCSVETQPSTPPQTPVPFSQPVRSFASARVAEGKTQDDWAYEAFVAFETLCGNAGRIAERIEEARSYEPEDPLPEHLW
jgi:hypothetical protein